MLVEIYVTPNAIWECHKSAEGQYWDVVYIWDSVEGEVMECNHPK